MNGGYLLLVGVSFGLLLILSQRVVPGRKRMFRGFLGMIAIIFVLIRTQNQAETLLGYILAVFLSFVFWLLIGRYNPVSDKSEIVVYGLND